MNTVRPTTTDPVTTQATEPIHESADSASAPHRPRARRHLVSGVAAVAVLAAAVIGIALGGALDKDSWITGTYGTDASGITFEPSGGHCGATVAFRWDGVIEDSGRIEATHQGSMDGDAGRVGFCQIPVGEPYAFTRIAPTSDAASAIVPATYFGGAPTATMELAGYWLVVETGQVLRWGSFGDYWLDGDGSIDVTPEDAGVGVIDDSTVTLTSGKFADRCAEGHVMVWTDLVSVDGALNATVASDGCGRGLPSEITLVLLGVDTP